MGGMPPLGYRLKRVGREMRMLVENSDDQTAADPSLLRIIALAHDIQIARAHDIQIRLSQNTKLTVHDAAREERVTEITRAIRLYCKLASCGRSKCAKWRQIRLAKRAKKPHYQILSPWLRSQSDTNQSPTQIPC
jgi:hypothetical protein